MIEINADSIKINGPRESDGNYTITFRTGEYSQKQISELMLIPRNVNIKVNISYDRE
jgi:hypothetical protein